MRRADLVALVRADVAAQRVAHAAGELDGVYEGETWGEYVDSLAYWETREGLTSEHVEYATDGFRVGHPRPRLTAYLVWAWFAAAREQVAS